MEKKESTSNIVKDYIFKQLEAQKLGIGSRLPTESQLSTLLNISRSSVREALHSLKGIGLVESSQGSGYTIISNTKKSFSDALRAMMAIKNIKFTDISEIREALEVKAAELAIKRGITSYDISYLKKCIDDMESIYKIDSSQATENDIKFHRKIASLSGNEFLNSFILALSDFSTRYILISWNEVDTEEAQRLLQTHRQIINFLEVKDTKQVVNEIINHYRIADEIINNHTDKMEISKHPAEYLLEKLYAEGFTSDQIYSKLTDLTNNEKIV